MAIKADPTRVPQRGDTADVWKNWHEALKSNFGKKVANQLFVSAWKTRGSTDVSTVSLRDYLKKNGIEISTTAFQDIADKGSDFADVFGDMFSVGKYAGIAIGVILIGTVGYALFNISRNPNQTLATGLKAYRG